MSSCFSYKDINRVLFVTAVMIDVDHNGNPILYAEVFKGVRGSASAGAGMDKRILFKGNGKTMFEAVRDMNAIASYKLNWTQNKAIIFTQAAAEYGVEDFIDFLDRDEELLLRPYIAVYVGDPEKLMKIDIVQEKYIGLLLVQIIENIKTTSRAITLTFNDFYNQRTFGDKANVVPIIDIKKDAIDAKLEINGGAVIKNDRMISILERGEGEGFSFLINDISGGTLEVTNPLDINKFVTLEILKSKTKTEVSYDGKIVHLKKQIKVKVDFGEAQKSIVFTKENINKIQEQAEKNIEDACNSIFAKYKGLGVDIFDIQEQFDEKYPKIKIQGDIINKTELKMEVKVQIMNIGDTKNFQ